MELSLIADGLLYWVYLVVLICFHEFAHAWTAWKLGDDTAYLQGRVSLNPIIHMEVIGTVVLPLMMIFLSMAGPTGATLAGLMLGWGRPVPVNINNLSKPRLHDSLISMAGPAMNFILAFLLFGVVKLGYAFQQPALVEIAERMITISLGLCFFNLLPVPPLDGSHLLLHLTRMSYEAYAQFARFGFIIIIVLLNISYVRMALAVVVFATAYLMQRLWGIDF